MNDLTDQSIAFFDRESTMSLAQACGLALENRTEEARVAFQQSAALTLRLRAEQAHKFDTRISPK